MIFRPMGEPDVGEPTNQKIEKVYAAVYVLEVPLELCEAA